MGKVSGFWEGKGAKNSPVRVGGGWEYHSRVVVLQMHAGVFGEIGLIFS